jgi:hypothetical protein
MSFAGGSGRRRTQAITRQVSARVTWRRPVIVPSTAAPSGTAARSTRAGAGSGGTGCARGHPWQSVDSPHSEPAAIDVFGWYRIASHSSWPRSRQLVIPGTVAEARIRRAGADADLGFYIVRAPRLPDLDRPDQQAAAGWAHEAARLRGCEAA